jgi:hypothetical protein
MAADSIFLACSNHGTYFYNQLASLQILVGDTNGAINTTKSYFSKQYLSQINSTGEQVRNHKRLLFLSALIIEQPLEAARTHPYHYRCYNLAAMIVSRQLTIVIEIRTNDGVIRSMPRSANS